jgi:hypothetical protein
MSSSKKTLSWRI